MNRGRMLSVLVVFLSLSAACFAQQLATLRVTVTDSTGALLPGATVTVKNVATSLTRSAVTNDHGLAVIASLEPGTYEVTSNAASFTANKITAQLAVGQIASLGVQMGISRQENVEVRDIAEGVDTEKSEVSQVIDPSKIADLPIAGRDFIDFVLLTPSVNVGRSTAVGAQSPFTETVLKLSFGGLRESHSAYFALDGIDYGTSISGVQRVSPSEDWVQEFRVVDSPYSAETGRNLGAVVNTITKSGSNQVHGSAYEFFRNDALNATTPLSAPGFNTLRMNQFGADIGGPLRKDKNFIFAGYEGQRRAESPLYSSFILGTINPGPACLGLPAPGTPIPAECASINAGKNFYGLQQEDLSSILQVDNYDKFIVRTNHVLSDRTTLNVNLLFNDTRKNDVRGAVPGQGLPSSFRNNPVRDTTLYGDLIHTFSPELTSDTLLQYGRRTFHLDPVGAGFEPAIAIPNLMSGGGFVGSISYYQEQRFQAAENLTWTHGSHSFKFGGELQPVWTTAQAPLFSPALAIFVPPTFFPSGPGTYVPVPIQFLFLEPRSFFGTQIPNRDPNFENGLYAGPSESVFNDATTVSYRHELLGLYAQDQWRARPNLSFTFGLRWDVDFMPSGEQLKQMGGFHPTQYKNFQPRVSFAYAFHGGKGVVRGGAGLFTAPFVYSDVMVSWVGASEFSYMNQPLLPEFANPSQDLIGFGPSGAVGTLPALGPGAAFPAFAAFTGTGAYPAPAGLVQFPLGYAKRDFPLPYSEQASLEVEHALGHDFYASVGYQWVHGLRMPVYFSINGLPNGFDATGKQLFTPADPNFGFVLYVTPNGYSIYNAGTASIRKAMSHNFNFLANYTYSKSIDIATTVNLPNTPQNYLNPNQDRAVGDNDVRHRFTLAFLAQTPKNTNALLRDFKASILLSAQSGRAYTINWAYGDANGDGFAFNDRVGNIGRNTYHGPGFFDTDLRIQRDLPITERVKASLSAEFFNLFNRTNILDLNHSYGSATGDFNTPIPQSFGDGITDNGIGGTNSFGTPQFTAPARQIQFSARFTF